MHKEGGGYTWRRVAYIRRWMGLEDISSPESEEVLIRRGCDNWKGYPINGHSHRRRGVYRRAWGCVGGVSPAPCIIPLFVYARTYGSLLSAYHVSGVYTPPPSSSNFRMQTPWMCYPPPKKLYSSTHPGICRPPLLSEMCVLSQPITFLILLYCHNLTPCVAPPSPPASQAPHGRICIPWPSVTTQIPFDHISSQCVTPVSMCVLLCISTHPPPHGSLFRCILTLLGVNFRFGVYTPPLLCILCTKACRLQSSQLSNISHYINYFPIRLSKSWAWKASPLV